MTLRPSRTKGAWNFDNNYLYPNMVLQNQSQAVRHSQKDPVNLDSCLKEFFKTDLLDVESRECGKCGKQGEASIRTRIKILPRVLIIHLKRFANNGTKLKNPLEFDEVLRIDKEFLSINSGRYGTHRKLMRSGTMVNYDDKIDISDVDRQREESHQYHLCSLIVHEGYSTNQGHYYAFVKHQDNNLWYRYDDDNVKLVGPDLSSVKR